MIYNSVSVFYEKADFNLRFEGIAYVLERRSRKLCRYYVA